MEQLTVGLFLATVNKSIVDYLADPIRKKYPNADLWWLIYVALGTGAVLAWYAQVNLFAGYIPDVLVGRIVSCVAVGGGSTLIHKIFDE